MILDGSSASADEMTVSPDADGRYAPVDDLLRRLAVQIRSGSGGGRRPEDVSSVD
jgi:hypothetical protein